MPIWYLVDQRLFEAAIKLARQYFLEKGGIPTSSCYCPADKAIMGNTLGGAGCRRKFCGGVNPSPPIMVEGSHIAPCFEYRERLETETAFEYGQRAANALEDEIERLGAESVMAFIAEPVVGATAGAVPAVEGYYKRIREICDQYGVLLILDEVMCGMGRTGSLFASEQEGIAPDIVCIAKGLGGGYQPIGAMLCSAEIYQAIESGSGFFQHGHTYLAHPTACAAGLAVVNAILQRGLIDRVQNQGDLLQARLTETFGQHPHVGDIRGRGLFRAIELVEDRATKKPFDSSIGLHKKIKKAAFEAGLVCYPGGGTIDGVNGDHVLLAPPYIIEDHQVDELVSKLDQAISQSI